MALPPTLPRRRTAALLLAVAGCVSLVILPIIGLIRIDESTGKSHQYTAIISTADSLGTHLIQMIRGSLAVFGAAPTAENRAAAVQDVELARAQLRELVEQQESARDLGVENALSAYLDRARPLLDLIDTFVAEIDGGATTETAESTAAVVNSGFELLSAQGEFTLAVSPLRADLDEARRDSLKEAKVLVGVSASLAGILGVALLFIDTRRIRDMFSSQEQRRESAERLAAHRGDVVNLASHELRSPLTVLTLSTDLLKDTANGRNDPEMAELAQDAHTAALRCESLVSELLDLGRIDADRLQLRLGATPLLPALNDAALLSEASHGAHPLLIRGADEVRVNADPERLRVILRNLIDNAFKYSPAGSDVHVDVREWEGRVRIDVRDEGEGVPEAYRERIFQRFERLSGTEHLPGVGIGLYLSRELARRMDGDLRCSPSDAGAAFQLELPQAG